MDLFHTDRSTSLNLVPGTTGGSRSRSCRTWRHGSSRAGGVRAEGAVPFNDADLRERADAAWEAAGLQRIGLHEARHTYASPTIESGVSINKVS